MESDSEAITQTPITGDALGSHQTPTPYPAWGKLQSVTTFLECIDLDKPNFLIGRGGGCDVILSKENFYRNSLKTVSKTHFIIAHDETKRVGCITDCSKNGTFVNKNMVGKDKNIILQDGDEIAIGTKEQIVYIYHTIEREKCPYLPPPLRHRYVTSRKLGIGACGEVMLLFERNTGEEFAVKKIIKTKVGMTPNLNTPERIQREISILQSLSHPCVISTKEIVETDEAVFIILEYMKGGDLVDRINSSLYPLPENDAKLIFYQIVIGVQYLHSRGITHRDLKPANVLLRSEDRETLVKISDFGLSKMFLTSTLMSSLCGTPYYVAPEVINMQYTQAVDIWSLGVILFNMLSKELPFKATHNHELFALILSGKYTMDEDTWKFVSKDAKDLVTQMLIRNPDKRIKIDDIINHPWIAKDQDMQRKVRLLTNQEENSSQEENSTETRSPPLKRSRLN